MENNSRFAARAALFTLLLVIGFMGFARDAGAEELKMVMLGDSLSAGYGLEDPEQENLVERLQIELNSQKYAALNRVEIINAGISGDTSAGGSARLDWSLSEGVRVLILELGGNDILRGFPPEVSKENLASIISRTLEKNVAVILIGMQAPPNLGRSMSEEIIKVFQNLSSEYNVPLYPFLLDGIISDPGFLQLDGIHPNAKGVEEIVRRMAPFIADSVKEFR